MGIFGSVVVLGEVAVKMRWGGVGLSGVGVFSCVLCFKMGGGGSCMWGAEVLI